MPDEKPECLMNMSPHSVSQHQVIAFLAFISQRILKIVNSLRNPPPGKEEEEEEEERRGENERERRDWERQGDRHRGVKMAVTML